jgi:uncharacterized protein with FMN-binding domain
MAKMNKKWVVLCSTAIGAIYAAGYFATDTQATMQQPQPQAQITIPTESSQPQQQVPVPTPTKSSQSQQQVPAPTPTKSSKPTPQAPAPTPTKSSQPTPQAPAPTPIKSNQVYKDGTYSGSGSNRRGSIQVAVTIKSDKITDVAISHFAMHYTIDDVVGLPQEVVQKQSAQVKNVSGATYSTQAFQDAVQVALSQARNS